MKVTRFANILVIGLVLTLAVSGCRKRPYATTVVPNSTTGLNTDVGQGGKVGGTGSDEGIKSTSEADKLGGIAATDANKYAGWKENAEALKAQTVYFAFDSSAIRETEQSKIAAVADYLKGNAAAALRVEGNCDERGTEEYNRALGDRRAQAVREALVALGIDAQKIVTVSYGEDRPAVQGHDETAWKLNRRDDFIVLTPP